jgi:hypothetical protein
MAHSLENARVIRLLNERAAARTRKEALAAGDGLPILTPARIALSCAEHEGYTTPELNDRLYLHFGGYRKIENLEPYVACKALWLDSNAITQIEGISQMKDLRCLYLQQNALSNIGPGLLGLSKLQTLDLSSNRITQIDGLDCLPLLSTLVISKNLLASSEALIHLQGCLQLTNLDLSDNSLVGDITLPPKDSPNYALAAEKASVAYAAATAAESAVKAAEANAKAILAERRKIVQPSSISNISSEVHVSDSLENGGKDSENEQNEIDESNEEDDEMEEEFISRAVSSVTLVSPTAPVSNGSLVDVLVKIPKLVTLYLKGNPCVRDTKHYRKTTVSSLPGLRYLDERPIFDSERFSTNAWATGGLEAERAAIRKLEENKRNANKSQIERFAEWQKEVRAKRSKELEDHNASLRASGAPEVAELPRRSYVSYQRVSTKFQTESLRLQRLSERAEKMAKANGLHETAMMDLGREWWAEEGVLDLDGNLVNRYPEESGPVSSSSSSTAVSSTNEDSQMPVRSALTTEKGEEEEERLVMEEVLKLERRERARLRALARRADGGPEENEDEEELFNNGSSLITSVNAPSRSIDRLESSQSMKESEKDVISTDEGTSIKTSEESQVLTASEIRIRRSLEIFNERRRLAQLSEKKEEETVEEEEEEDGTADEDRLSTCLAEKVKAKEFAKTREDFLARLANARKEVDANIAQVPKEIEKEEILSQSSSISLPESQSAIVPLSTMSTSDLWTPQLDSALTKLVNAANFDFSRAARGLKSALLRGLLTAGGSVSPEAASELLDEDSCRLRFTAITASTKVSKEAPPIAETPLSTATVASGSANATSSMLPSVKVIRAGSGVGSSRAPLLSSLSGPVTVQAQQPVNSSSPLLGIAFQGRIKPVADLLGDQFELRGFKNYVSVNVDSLPTVATTSNVETKVSDEDEDNDQDNEGPLTSSEIMRQLERERASRL